MARSSASRRDFVRAAMRAPYLERDEEHDLAVRWHEARDQAALHRLTSAHMRLVIAIAARFRNFGLPMGDLIQEGHVGLLEAAAREMHYPLTLRYQADYDHSYFFISSFIGEHLAWHAAQREIKPA